MAGYVTMFNCQRFSILHYSAMSFLIFHVCSLDSESSSHILPLFHNSAGGKQRIRHGIIGVLGVIDPKLGMAMWKDGIKVRR